MRVFDVFLLQSECFELYALGFAVFLYSSFLPDLPSIYRKKAVDSGVEGLPWYKRSFILLFAPLLVWILFSGIRLNWRTSETYHNFNR